MTQQEMEAYAAQAPDRTDPVAYSRTLTARTMVSARNGCRAYGIDPDAISPMPYGSGCATVTIGGVPYASFLTRGDAVEAADMWRAWWPAVHGKAVDVVG